MYGLLLYLGNQITLLDNIKIHNIIMELERGFVYFIDLEHDFSK
jgi:hypothetical protein